MFSRILIYLFAMIPIPALANQNELPETSWTLQGYRCPFGCQSETEEFMRTRLNERLELDGRELVDSVLGSCPAGNIKADVTLKPLELVLEEMNVNLPAGMAFTPANTGLHQQTLNTAHIYCETSDEAPRTLAWAISLSASEMITFEENATLLVFGPASRKNLQ